MSDTIIAFTTRSLEALRPGADVAEIGRTGLRIRVGASGVKSFRWICSALGRTFLLGRFGNGTNGTITLAQARAKLEQYKAKVAAGVDPEATTDPELARPRTVADLANTFFKESLSERRKRAKDARQILDRDIVKVIGRVPLVALDTMACRRPVLALVKAGHHRSAAVALALLKQMLRFGVANGLLPVNPAADLDPRSFGIFREKRERWLTAEEIPVVLTAIETSGMDVFSKLALKVLFFAGLRTHELLSLEWTDVDLEAATLSVRPENMKLDKGAAKTAKVYVVPLSPPALAAMKELRALAPEKERWVFRSPRSKGGPLSDKALARAMRRLWLPERKGGAPVPNPPACPPVCPHDFRRTMSTNMSEVLRLPPHVAQLVLGHSLNALLGSNVAGTYDRSSRLEERRQALEAYAVWVEGLLTGKTAEVVPFPAGGDVRAAQ